MMGAQIQTMVFVVAALVVGAVIFGGTTLAYFKGKRPSHAAPVAVEPWRRGSGGMVVEHDADAQPDAA